MDWIEKLEKISGVKSPMGYRDAIGRDGKVSNRVLFLDNSMLVLGLQGNTANTKYVTRYFEATGKLEKVKALYAKVDMANVKATPEPAPVVKPSVPAPSAAPTPTPAAAPLQEQKENKAVDNFIDLLQGWHIKWGKNVEGSKKMGKLVSACDLKPVCPCLSGGLPRLR